MAKVKLSHRDIRSRLSAALETANPGVSVYIADIWPDPAEVVYNIESPGPSYARQLMRATWAIDGDTVTLGTPERVVETTSYEKVSFSADFSVVSVGKDKVRYTGKIFELGKFPDKEFSLDAAEADAAVAAFSPVHINSEHGKSVFDKKLGQLVGIARDGKDIVGEMEVPRALFDLVGEHLPVSCEWGPISKSLDGIALAHNPRIDDAKLTAAFSKAEEPRNGGVVSNFIETLLARFSKEDRAQLKQALDNEPGTPPVDPATAAELERLRNENAQFKANQSTDDSSRIATAATAFADRIIKTDRRALPAERESIEAMFSDALRDDNAGKACFSADGNPAKGERMERLEKYFANRPKLDYDEDKLKEAQIVFSVTGKPQEKAEKLPTPGEIYAKINGEGGA